MPTANLLKSKSAIIVLSLICAILVISAMLLPKAFVSPKQKQQQTSTKLSPYFRNGFDFSLLRREENTWRGPDFGEKIDLTQLKGASGTTHLDAGNAQLLMVVAVSPECGMCGVAADEMRYVRDQIAARGIPYYVVSFIPLDNPAGFFKYCDSLGLGVPEFLWTKEQPLASLSNMAVPSHLLLDKDGVIIRTWPGSNDDKAFRIRMGNQIVADTNVITDTLEMLRRKSNVKTDREKL